MEKMTNLALMLMSTILQCTWGYLDLSQVVFVVMSHNHSRHEVIALETEEKLKAKLLQKFVVDPEMYLRHRDLPGNLGRFNPQMF